MKCIIYNTDLNIYKFKLNKNNSLCMWYLRRGDYFWKKREHSANNVCKELKVGIWEYARCTALWICLLISVENVLHLEKHRVLSMTDQNSLLWSTNMHYFWHTLGQRFPYFLRRGALFRTEIRRGALSSPLNQRHVCAYLAVFT